MKRKIGMELISKELVISAGVGVIIGILVLSYASNNNFDKLEKADVHSELSELADRILTTEEISNKGILNSLASKVMAANKALDAGDTETAVQSLEDLISQVTDQRGKKIPSGEADLLIDLAEAAIENIQPTAESCDGVVMDDGTCCLGVINPSDGICCPEPYILVVGQNPEEYDCVVNPVSD